MHPYATDSDERFQVPFYLALISIGVAWVIYWILTKVPSSLPIWLLDVPATWGTYGLLWKLVELRLWKRPGMRKIGLVKVPDLGGKWKGILLSSYDDYKTQHPITLDIQQSWTKILVTLTAKQSRSYSIIGGIMVGNGKLPVLSYDYLNEPKPDALGTMQMHRGMVHLELQEDGSLDGDYFTGRSRNTTGRMKLTRFAS